MVTMKVIFFIEIMPTLLPLIFFFLHHFLMLDMCYIIYKNTISVYIAWGIRGVELPSMGVQGKFHEKKNPRFLCPFLGGP
jgi:hypothetical protein